MSAACVTTTYDDRDRGVLIEVDECIRLYQRFYGQWADRLTAAVPVRAQPGTVAASFPPSTYTWPAAPEGVTRSLYEVDEATVSCLLVISSPMRG